MTAKRVVLKIHLWLGLTSGVVIVFLGLTGCILAFQKEIESVTQSYRYVHAREQEFLSPSALKNIAEPLLPEKHIHAVLYEGKSNAAQVIFYAFEPEEYYYIVYVNPYDGTVLKVKNMNRDFFRQVIVGHYYLWLPPHIGQPIVASATLIFLVMMITGLVLWWPKNKGALKQRFSIKWNARWRRKNYDLHYVLGFYMTWVAIILAFTGLVWGFQWFAHSIYTITGGEKSIVYSEPASDTLHATQSVKPAIDMVWDKMKTSYPAAEILEVHVPAGDTDPIAANANPDASTYWQTDYRYFDRYTLKELPAASIYGKLKDATAADKLIRMNYDLHTGGIIGLPGKMLMFCASLIAASLPITGFYIWRGRTKKKKVDTAYQAHLSRQPIPDTRA